VTGRALGGFTVSLFAGGLLFGGNPAIAADDELGDQLYLLEQALAQGDCKGADKISNALVEKHVDAPDVWKARANVGE